MRTIIALHGNPGHPDDWNLIREKLAPEDKFIAVNSYDPSWMETVISGDEKKILLGHSWGCYQILKNLRTVDKHVEKVILCAPYFVFERQISKFAQTLLKMPLLGDLLLKRSHRQAKDQFLKDLLSPRSENDFAYFLEIKNRLDDWHVWKTTAFAKIKTQDHELTKEDSSMMNGIVFFGQQDVIANSQRQSEVLKFFPNIKIVHIANTGHEMIWSQANKIAEIIDAKEV